MQIFSNPTLDHPIFPTALALPFKIIPSQIHNKLLTTTLNKIFATDLNEGELSFLQDKVIHIFIEDIGVEYRFTLKQNKLMPANNNQSADLSLKGTVYDYLLLASRREDTDTLFFSRRLHMHGDTELGLHVKNFLDGLDMDSHQIPAYIETILNKNLPLYEKLFT